MRTLFAKLHRTKRGFTLMETLLTVAIISILAAVAVPGAVSLRNDLKQTELDVSAREIYVAAQNSLTRMKVGGTLGQLSGSSMTGSKPADFPVNWDWNADHAYYFADQGTATAQKLLPEGAIDASVRGGYYVIEYNAQTATVYSVFYAQTPDFSYESAADLDTLRTDKSARKEEQVGYYSGNNPVGLISGIVGGGNAKLCASPELTVTNDNDLILTIGGAAPYGVTVWVSDGVSGHAAVELTTLSDTHGRLTNNGDGTYTLRLDSLTGKNFRDADRFPTLTPGENLKITVQFEKSGLISTTADVTVNSLFGSRSGGAATVYCARHLQNLDAGFSGVTSGVTTVSQTADIDWSAVRWPAETAETAKYFSSIVNSALTSFDGGEREIRGLKGTNGLFASAPAALNGICIVNPIISGGSNVGALAGSATGSMVTNCRVYAYEISGGMIAYSKYPNYGLTATGTAGGLIGSALNCTITGSFAALPHLHAPSGGGLIGSASGSVITGCYASCDDFTGTGTLVAAASSTNVTGSYAVGFSKNQAVEALTFAPGAAVKSSYCAYADQLQSHLYKTYAASGTEAVQTGEDSFLEALATLSGYGIATHTYPYSAALSNRAYPFGATLVMLNGSFVTQPHYGSWPANDGHSIDVKLDIASGYYAGFTGDASGTVTLSENGTELYTGVSKENAASLASGKTLHVGITPAADFEVSSIHISYTLGGVNHTASLGKALSSDFTMVATNIKLTVVFSPAEFVLTMNTPVNGTYTAKVGSRTLASGDKVRYGDTITVAAAGTTNTYGVTYQPKVQFNSQEVAGSSGNYSILMAPNDSELKVLFTTDQTSYKIEYYVMNVSGNYAAKPTSSTAWATVADGATFTPKTEHGYTTTDSNGETVFSYAKYQVVSKSGTVLQSGSDGKSYAFSKDQQQITIKIYFSRETFSVTLKAGIGISTVTLPGSIVMEQSSPLTSTATEKTITRSYYYGERLTVSCICEPGMSFTKWAYSSANVLNPGTQNRSFSFTLGAGSVTLMATANERTTVRVNLKINNTEDWTNYPSQGQKVFLVDRNDATRVFELNKYIGYAEGEVDSGREYYLAYGNSLSHAVYYNGGNSTLVSVSVASASVSLNMYFYTLTYFPNATNYTGTVPTGGIYPRGSYVVVSWNYGYLHNGETTFLGWQDNESGVSANEYLVVEDDGRSINNGTVGFNIMKQTNLYAKWSTNARPWRIIYDGNGADITSVMPVDPNEYSSIYGDTFTAAAADPATLYREGYTFAYWCELKDGSGTRYEAGVSGYAYPYETKSMTLYAIWQANPVEVRFYADHVSPDPIYIDHTVNHERYVFNDTPEAYLTAPEGSWFGGWVCDEDGVTYQNGDWKDIHGDTTLYALWNSGTKYTVEYYNGGSSPIDSVNIGEGQFRIRHEAPATAPSSAAGSGFVGWRDVTAGSSGKVYICVNDIALEQMEINETGYPGRTIKLQAVWCNVWNYDKNVGYATLYAAQEAASSGNTLIFYNNTTETKNIIISGKKLNLVSAGDYTATWSGTTFTASGSTYNITTPTTSWGTSQTVNFAANSCLTVYNGSVVSLGAASGTVTGKIDGTLTLNANREGRVLSVYPNSTLHQYAGVTLTNGKVGDGNYNSNTQYGDYGGGVFVCPASGSSASSGGGSFYMHGGKITFCEAERGGGVYLYYTSFMSMGDMVPAVSEPYASSTLYYDDADGDGVWTLTKDPVSATSSEYYYGKTVDGNPVYRIVSGSPEIAYNTATVNNGTDGGGGLFLKDLADKSMLLYSGLLHANYASGGNGGGILTDSYTDDVDLYIYEMEISNNRASQGGGLYQWQGVIVVYNATIIDNYSTGNGGGICLTVSPGQMSDIRFYFGTISHNTADNNGGGIYIPTGCSVYMYSQIAVVDPPELCFNRAGNSGGGIYVKGGSTSGASSGNLYLAGGSIHDNKDAGKIRTNDVYLNGYACITVPNYDMNLMIRYNADLVTAGTRIVFDCDTAFDGRKIVHYSDAVYYLSTDCNYFKYSPGTANSYDLVPNDSDKELQLRTGASTSAKTITFDANGGMMSGVGETRELRYYLPADGQANPVVTSFPTALRENYVFLGWATSADLTEGDVGASYELTANTTLYAIWGQSYALTYEIGADALADSVTAPVGGSFCRVTIAGPSAATYQKDEETYYFYGWSTTEGDTTVAYRAGDRIILTQDTALHAVWKTDKPTFTVTFLDYDGTTAKTEAVLYGENATAPALSRDGYTFDGWDGVYSNVTSNKTVTALYTPISYTISYQLGGAPAQSLGPTAYTIESTDLLPTATYSGYEFMGWKVETASGSWTTASPYAAATALAGKYGDVTLTAQWTNAIYTVVFNKNSSLAGGTMGNYIFALGAGGSLPANTFTRADYVFAGWATSSGGSAVYANGADVTGIDTGIAVSRTITLYAVWQYKYYSSTRYTVHFDANGGSGSMADQTFYGDEYYYYSTFLSANTFSQSGKIFAGWNTKPDGTGSAYNDSGYVYSVISDTLSTDITLYAQWKNPRIGIVIVSGSNSWNTTTTVYGAEQGGSWVLGGTADEDYPNLTSRGVYVFYSTQTAPTVKVGNTAVTETTRTSGNYQYFNIKNYISITGSTYTVSFPQYGLSLQVKKTGNNQYAFVN